ncbi:MAG TPA: serine/threonine-protein kinase [Cellulomonas sp.]|uniref:serine/threonine-protein kinase n=1 Tax=Cellulomonas sp. TaxID=40001 RepID=UPI002E333954|nr:serine/threonine-protein kinase [Cellulomonas sp.]HEX5333555.1 serine/threonine-protein kinase [Cellulomonas sp.]
MSDTENAAVAGSLVGDRYRIEAVIGHGGTAAVYRARDEILGRVVALKVIPQASADASAVRRARAEVELLASLNHHALVTLFDAGVDEVDGSVRTFLVMELVDGPTLGARIQRGPLARADVCRMAVDLAEALHVVHASGIVHRDIKPGNVLLGSSPLPTHEFTAKLADFGIAHLIDSTRLTAAGGLVGTAAYLSPEQARGAAPAPASDVYSLGLVLLESLTRTRAFPGALMESVGARLVSDPPIPGSVGSGWAALLSAMTARDPEARPTAVDVAVAARALEREAAASEDALASSPATEALGASVGVDTPTTLTVPMDAHASGSTAIMPAAVIAQLGRDAANRAAEHDAGDATGRGASLDGGHGERHARGAPSTGGTRTHRTRRPLVLAAVGLLVVVAAVVAVPRLAHPAPTPSTAPTVPALVEPLRTDLQALLTSVSP